MKGLGLKHENEQHPKVLELPEAPAGSGDRVKAWIKPVILPTYLPEKPERNPMFLEKRVYQGSSGRVYPLPYTDRIATEAIDHEWQAVHLENEYIRLMVLPEIGGRIHVGLDKTNGYDFFYRQNVIKPALVGLAGPWISGGVEFNWPQHHRPATFMPVTVDIERHADGSVTIWCNDYDRLSDMKGMHGVCLHPGKAYIELKVRLYNGTVFTQTFLWWANVAARVHEAYQSFFPPDISYVADHAKRAISKFPYSDSTYYGIDYAERARSGVPPDELPDQFQPNGTYAANDLSWYANIPVPTSYMILGTEGDFFGGYDHSAQAGFVHVANHHIAPGKKQWTWGNHDFGYAWDRSLTDNGGPYVELMAGVYTDNQPDFSYLAPGETRTFQQYWYPIRAIGPPDAANLRIALKITKTEDEVVIGFNVTENIPGVTIKLRLQDATIAQWQEDLVVEAPLSLRTPVPGDIAKEDLEVVVLADARVIITYKAGHKSQAVPPETATEPLQPRDIATVEELYLTGLHLEQYRHATRQPELYWQEALRRDPLYSEANRALGLWRLRRGEFVLAEGCFRSGLLRVTKLNPNPRDGELFYNLGIALRFQGRREEAYRAFYKATWNAARRSASYLEIARLDVALGEWEAALAHIESGMCLAVDNLHLRNLEVVILRRLGRQEEASTLLAATRRLDRLDSWSRYLLNAELPVSEQQALLLSFDLIAAHQLADAIHVLSKVSASESSSTEGARPIALYSLAWCYALQQNTPEAEKAYRAAQAAPYDYCFPSRLEELVILEAAVARNPDDGRAHYYLGNLFYDKRRYSDAILHWEKAAILDEKNSVVWRNLGIAYFNVTHENEKAAAAFDQAFLLDKSDARLLFERDQLWKRTGILPSDRLSGLDAHLPLVWMRDDLSLEYATLQNLSGQPEKAEEILLSRRFQPWEGGEGLAIAQYVQAQLLLGQKCLGDGDALQAEERFLRALRPPPNLGEANHLLVNQSEIYFWLGEAHLKVEPHVAADWYRRAAQQKGDFQLMSVQSISEATYWSAQALRRLGDKERSDELFRAIEAYSYELEAKEPTIDYFATSLPAMLIFEDDLAKRNRISARYLRAQAVFGLKQNSSGMGIARELVEQVLAEDCNHLGARLLLESIAAANVPAGNR